MAYLKPISNTINEISDMLERSADRKNIHAMKMSELELRKAQLKNQFADQALSRESNMLKLEELRSKFEPTGFNFQQVMPRSDIVDPMTYAKLKEQTADTLSGGQGYWGEGDVLFDKRTSKPFTVRKFEHGLQLQKAHGFILANIDPDQVLDNQITLANQELKSFQMPLEGWEKQDPSLRLQRRSEIAKAKRTLGQLVKAKTDPNIRMGMHLTHSQVLDAYANSLMGQVPVEYIKSLRSGANNAIDRAQLLELSMSRKQGNKLKRNVVGIPLYKDGKKIRIEYVDKNNLGSYVPPEGYTLGPDKEYKDTINTKLAVRLDKKGKIVDQKFVHYSQADAKGKALSPKDAAPELSEGTWKWGTSEQLTQATAKGRDLSMTEAQAHLAIQQEYGKVDPDGQFLVTPKLKNRYDIATATWRQLVESGVKPGLAKEDAINTVAAMTRMYSKELSEFRKALMQNKKLDSAGKKAALKDWQELYKARIQNITATKDAAGNVISTGVYALPE